MVYMNDLESLILATILYSSGVTKGSACGATRPTAVNIIILEQF